jgi:hypothetical protein
MARAKATAQAKATAMATVTATAKDRRLSLLLARCSHDGKGLGTRRPVWPGRRRPRRASRSGTARRAPPRQRRAPTRQPGPPRSPTRSTRGGGRRIGTGGARGRGGRVGARTPRRRRRQRPTTLTSAPSSRLKYDIVSNQNGYRTIVCVSACLLVSSISEFRTQISYSGLHPKQGYRMILVPT